ncbi:MAG TPA: ATP synthase subunit I [Deltaproteobacteria bacterium]|nr:ATP synthase subunit I [Deltaproteobacteria bacterium]
MTAGIDMASCAFAFVAGCALGVFFCLHLWKSVQGIASGGAYTFSHAAGFLVRAGVVTAGFFLVSSGRWERASAALAGFILARLIMVRALGAGRQGA